MELGQLSQLSQPPQLPQPPQDPELRNIIDKLAQFVARNGPEFERMTKTKQKDNPKFGFLYGGEHYEYYRYRLTADRAAMDGQGRGQPGGRCEPDFSVDRAPNAGPARSDRMRGDGSRWRDRAELPLPERQLPGMPPSGPPALGPPPNIPPPSAPAPSPVEALTARQDALREQIKQSEANLNAQHAVLIGRQQIRIEEVVANAQEESVRRLAIESCVSLTEFDAILQPIIDTCTKDSISAGKGWILSRAVSREAGTAIAQYLLRKSTRSKANFIRKLHIIYLVNDVLHHCVRKNADELKKCLESVVIPMFCNAAIGVTGDQEAKLDKLLKLWESKSNYFDQSVIDKMKNPTTSYQEYQTNLISQFAHLVAPITVETQTTYENYQKQHQAFVAHSLQQIQQLEMQIQTIERQVTPPMSREPEPMPPSNIPHSMPPNQNFNPNYPDGMFPRGPPIGNSNPMMNFDQQQFCNNRPPMFSAVNQQCYQNNFIPPSGQNPDDFDRGYDFDVDVQRNRIIPNEDPGPMIPAVNFSQPPPGFFNENDFQNGLPDLSKPPPGFNKSTQEISLNDLISPLPYYEMPAGLMLPLILLGDNEYKSLDPEALRLPNPTEISDRLLAAIDAFYSKPESKSIDNDGWEKSGLLEYLKIKNIAKKQKEEAIKSGERPKSRSPSPINFELLGLRSPTIRRYRSKSRSVSPDRGRSSPGYQRSISPSSDRDQDRERTRRRRRRSSPTAASPPPRNERRSESPEMIGFRGTEMRRPSRPAERSPTPPSFVGSSYGNPNQLTEVDSSNKGHQMLRKMGWSGKGSGLGAAGQGISAPIDAGFIRDKQDQYKGLGVTMNDPFENFRKNKGAAFITRMRERALERTT